MVLSEEDLHVQVGGCHTFTSRHLSHRLSLFNLFHSLRSDKEELIDLRNYKHKAQNESKKKKVLSSVYSG